MPFTDFYSILPSIRACYTIGRYSTTKLSGLAHLHYRIVTLSALAISKVTYGSIIVQGPQFYMSGEFLALFIKY